MDSMPHLFSTLVHVSLILNRRGHPFAVDLIKLGAVQLLLFLTYEYAVGKVSQVGPGHLFLLEGLARMSSKQRL